MPISFQECQAIGVFVSVKLMDDTVVKGTIFTYNPPEELLVLTQGLTEGNSNVKIIRTNYIKEVSIVSDCEEKLPSQLDVNARLPSMQAGRDKSLFKNASSQLRVAREKRTALLQAVDKNTQIGALDTLTKLARIYPETHWDKDEGVIRIDQEVFVGGKPDWRNPIATAVDGAGENSQSMVERIQKALSKK